METGKSIPSMDGGKPDVLVLGEVLVELTAQAPLREADTLRISCSGDALNAAAAAAAAGASVALVTAVGDDELGDRILEFVAASGIDTAYVQRRPEPNGVYFAGAGGEFVYARRGSAGSTLGPGDVARAPLGEAGAVVVSGITQALSASCAAAVDAAVSGAGGHVVYDPNFRARLTSAEDARAALARVAPHAALVTPSCPDDTCALLGTADPAAAASRVRELGAEAVAVTIGDRGVYLDAGDEPLSLAAAPAPAVVDATGAGDVLAGTAAARLAHGDDLPTAVRHAAAAAARSLAGQGGTGWLRCGSVHLEVELLPPENEAVASELAALINRAYEIGEAGLWREGTAGRIDEPEVAEAIRAGHMLAATAEGRIVGCARTRSLDPTTADIGLITADPEAWGTGIGRALITTAESLARTRGHTTMQLELLVPRTGTHPTKERLRDWYTRLGYTVARTVPFEHYVPQAAPFLTAPGDVLLFTKPLP